MHLTPEQKFELLRIYFQTNQVSLDNLSTVVATFSNLDELTVIPEKPSAPEMSKKEWKKLIKNDSIVSLIDGKSYKILKRHLSIYNYTPERYRVTFGLPADFPMVAPAYSKIRSEKAKAMGLGTRTTAE